MQVCFDRGISDASLKFQLHDSPNERWRDRVAKLESAWKIKRIDATKDAITGPHNELTPLLKQGIFEICAKTVNVFSHCKKCREAKSGPGLRDYEDASCA